MLTQEQLKAELEYDPETGLFRWKVIYGSRKRNWFAGALTPNGYFTLKFAGKTYYVHHLVWLFVNGEMGVRLDHRDRNRENNRIENLRPADKAENAINSTLRTDNKSGHVGVSWHAPRGKWQVRLTKNQKLVTSKLFADKDAAIAYYQSVAAVTFGEFVPESAA